MASRGQTDPDEYVAEPQSIELRDYWAAVRRRWRWVVIVAILGAAAGLGYGKLGGESYSATAEVVVLPVTQGPLNITVPVLQQVNINTEQAVAQSGAVVNRAAKFLGVPAAQLQAEQASRLTVTVPALSNELQIAWSAASPQSARRGANAFAKAYLNYRHSVLSGQIGTLEAALSVRIRALISQIDRVSAHLSQTSATSARHDSLTAQLASLESQLSAQQLTLGSLPTYDDSGGTMIAAPLPVKPVGFGTSVVIVLGLLVGLLLGLVLAVLRDIWDDRVRDPAQIDRALGAPALAADPRMSLAEAVRAVRAMLTAVSVRGDLRTILLVSADSEISSSRVTADLGLAVAESGRRVLLVAADLRGSTLPQIFGAPSATGLSDLLSIGGDPATYICQPGSLTAAGLPPALVSRLALLPNGHHSAGSRSMLDSDAMAGLLRSQRDAYDFVLLDSPPVTSAADVISLAAQADAVVVLVREGRTRARALSGLRDRLGQAGARVVGGVLIGDDEASDRKRRTAGRAANRAPSGQAPAGHARGPVTAEYAPPVTRPFHTVADGGEEAGVGPFTSRPV